MSNQKQVVMGGVMVALLCAGALAGPAVGPRRPWDFVAVGSGTAQRGHWNGDVEEWKLDGDVLEPIAIVRTLDQEAVAVLDAGDDRLKRIDLKTGAVSTIINFAALGERPRDVYVAASRGVASYYVLGDHGVRCINRFSSTLILPESAIGAYCRQVAVRANRDNSLMVGLAGGVDVATYFVPSMGEPYKIASRPLSTPAKGLSVRYWAGSRQGIVVGAAGAVIYTDESLQDQVTGQCYVDLSDTVWECAVVCASFFPPWMFWECVAACAFDDMTSQSGVVYRMDMDGGVEPVASVAPGSLVISVSGIGGDRAAGAAHF